MFAAVCGTIANSRSKRGVIEIEAIDQEYGYGLEAGAIAAPASGAPIPDLQYGIVDLVSSPVPVDAAPIPPPPHVEAIEPPTLPLETESVIPNVPFLIQSGWFLVFHFSYHQYNGVLFAL